MTPIVTLEPGDDAVAAVRAAALQAGAGESLVVVIRPGRDAGGLVLARAAIATAALDRAPLRVNAVNPGPAVTPEAVARAIAFLRDAPAITGQIVDLS